MQHTPCIVLSMPESYFNTKGMINRREYMSTLLGQMGFTNWSFFTPVTPDEAYKAKPTLKLKPGNASHTVSSIEALKRGIEEAHSQGIDRFLVMEDDIAPVGETDLAVGMMNEAVTSVSDKNLPWELIMFEYCFETCRERKRVSNVVHKMHSASCSACTLYHVDGARNIIEQYNSTDDVGTFDDFLKKLNLSGGLQVYGRRVFFQHPKFGSTLENSVRYATENPEPDPPCADEYKLQHWKYIFGGCVGLLVILLTSLPNKWAYVFVSILLIVYVVESTYVSKIFAM